MSERPPIIAASTIMLVRDADDLQVLMVQRHHQIEFSAGALVFPGGKVDPTDFLPDWTAKLDGGAGDPADNALRIAAIREAFEESGVLLARPAARRGVGTPLLNPAEAPDIFQAVPDHGARAEFLAMIARHDLVLAIDALIPFANWLTPDVPASVMAKRFDTHFFLAAAPPAQVVVCDGREAVESRWINPHHALAEAAAKRCTIVFPTQMNLELLGNSSSVADAFAATRARPPVKVTPRIVEEDGVKTLRIAAEAGYARHTFPLDALPGADRIPG